MLISYVTYCSLPKSFLKLNHFNLYVYYVITKMSSASIISIQFQNKDKRWFFESIQAHHFVQVLFAQFKSNLNLVFKLTAGWRLLHNIFCEFFWISCLSLSVWCRFLIGYHCFGQGVVAAERPRLRDRGFCGDGAGWARVGENRSYPCTERIKTLSRTWCLWNILKDAETPLINRPLYMPFIHIS